MMEGPLTELRNQRQPRRKLTQTYGRKKTRDQQAAERELFGMDQPGGTLDEIEKKLADLGIETSKPSQPTPKSSPRKSDHSNGHGKDKKPAAISDTKTKLISDEDASAIEPLLSMSESNIEIFSTFGSKLSKSYNIEKIGEGSFAEVFKLTANPKSTSSKSQSQPAQVPPGGAIIKVIPLLHPSSDPSSDDRTSEISSVVREVKVFRTLDSIHGFTRFRGIRIVTGEWPRSFLTAFQTFAKANRNRALNRPPDEDFNENQIYALVEMGDAGTELFTVKRPSAFQVYDIFWMSVILIANAEEQVEFEHRDLHLSNICVKPQNLPLTEEEEEYEYDEDLPPAPPHLDIDPTKLSTMTEPPTHKLGLSNLKVTLIDYTISRCNLSPQTPRKETPSSDPEVAYDTLSFLSPQSSAFDEPSPASSEDTHQLLTYRLTRAVAQLHALPDSDKWSRFLPQTNVLWLAYVLTTLRTRAQGRISPANWPDKPYVVRGSSAAAKKTQEQIWRGLWAVENDIAHQKGESPEEVAGVLNGARELLGRAVEEGWIGLAEIEGFKARLEGPEE